MAWALIYFAEPKRKFEQLQHNLLKFSRIGINDQ